MNDRLRIAADVFEAIYKAVADKEGPAPSVYDFNWCARKAVEVADKLIRAEFDTRTWKDEPASLGRLQGLGGDLGGEG